MTPSVCRAMLLAAGKGERLRPLTERIPKPLIPVGGRPMIHRILDLLAAAGIADIHINTHHLGEQLSGALGDGARWGVSLTYHPETEILGTGGGLLAARKACPAFADGPFVMINSDILTDIDLAPVIARHLEDPPLATLVLRPDPDAERYGVIGADGDGRIRRFLKLDLGGARHDYMFTGIQVLSPEIFDYMPGGGPFPITDSYLAALEDGASLGAWVHEGYWKDMGTPERLLEAEADLAAGRVAAPAAP